MLKQMVSMGLGLSIVATSLLADVEKKKLTIGFIALTDCAPIVIAKEKGFFEKHGLDVKVVKAYAVPVEVTLIAPVGIGFAAPAD